MIIILITIIILIIATVIIIIIIIIQDATFTFIDVAPQWQSFNAGKLPAWQLTAGINITQNENIFLARCLKMSEVITDN